MDKAYLNECVGEAMHNYIWTLYFFNSRKRRNSGYIYEGHKVRFTNNADLISYSKQLLRAVTEYQLNPLCEVEEYNGFNTKCSCDRLCVNDEIISENFTAFRNSIINAAFADVKDSYKGYLLEGQPAMDSDGVVITFLRFANPTAKLKTKKSVFYKKAEDSSLDEITEQFYRMYLTVDAILINDQLYNFTHAFERIFDVEQTLHKVKAQAIQTIVDAGFIANGDTFSKYAQSTNARTFITLSNDRIQRASDADNRNSIASDFNVPLESNGLFHISESEHTSRLLKYFCYKAFKDSETNELLEASGITKMSVADVT